MTYNVLNDQVNSHYSQHRTHSSASYTSCISSKLYRQQSLLINVTSIFNCWCCCGFRFTFNWSPIFPDITPGKAEPHSSSKEECYALTLMVGWQEGCLAYMTSQPDTGPSQLLEPDCGTVYRQTWDNHTASSGGHWRHFYLDSETTALCIEPAGGLRARW